MLCSEPQRLTSISRSTSGKSESGRSPASLLLISSGGALRPALDLVAADDGDGFQPDDRALTPGSGMGLLCMEERAPLVDGTVRIRPAPGRGTVVAATRAVPEGRR